MRRSTILLFGMGSLAVGCGGNVIASGGGAGGTGGAGGATVTTSVPAECAVATNQPAPYTINFAFAGVLSTPVYLREDCHIVYTITSCADGYSEPIAIHADCTTDCSNSMECIQCGPCLETALQVTQDTWQGDTWGGSTYTFGQNAAGCTCHNTFNAPAGKYRISIPVFATAADATNNTNASTVEHDFDLPSPDNSVTVPITLGVK